MDKLIPVLIALGAAIMLLKAFQGSGGGKTHRQPAPVAKRFMTRRELAMLDALERCLPQYRFHAQVSMGALLAASLQAENRSHPASRNVFSQKIVDFVAQDRATGDVVALIEVDDRTHNAARDSDRDAMTGAAGYRTIRIGKQVQPRIAEVRFAVAELFTLPSNSN